MSNREKRRIHQERAVAGVIFAWIIGAMIGVTVVWIILGPIVDADLAFHNNATQGAHATLPVSQERQNSLYLLTVAYNDYPLIMFILGLLGAVVAALNWRTKPV